LHNDNNNSSDDVLCWILDEFNEGHKLFNIVCAKLSVNPSYIYGTIFVKLFNDCIFTFKFPSVINLLKPSIYMQILFYSNISLLLFIPISVNLLDNSIRCFQSCEVEIVFTLSTNSSNIEGNWPLYFFVDILFGLIHVDVFLNEGEEIIVSLKLFKFIIFNSSWDVWNGAVPIILSLLSFGPPRNTPYCFFNVFVILSFLLLFNFAKSPVLAS